MGTTLLPDGQAFAYIVPTVGGPQNRIRVFSLKGLPPKDIIVHRATRLESLDGLLSEIGFLSTDVRPKHRDLLLIRPDGTSQVLWSPKELMPTFAIPSPDGKHVAISAESRQSNAWMLTDF